MLISKRKFKMFMAKWGGIAISVVFILLFSGFGAHYIYSVNRVDNTLAWVTQSVNIDRVNSATVDTSKQIATFHVKLKVMNTTNGGAEITASDIVINLNGMNLEMTPSNDWTMKAPANQTVYIEGDVTMSEKDFNDLRSKGATPFTITGKLYAKVRYGIVMRDAERPININSRIQIY